MEVRRFVIRIMPESWSFADAVERMILEEEATLKLLARDENTPEDSLGKELVISRLKEIKTSLDGKIVRFAGWTAKCEVAHKGEFVEGMYDKKRGKGEVNLSPFVPKHHQV